MGAKEEAMWVILFVCGAAGALLTVYLAKQVWIPEFRPFSDTTADQAEAEKLQNHIVQTNKNIDDTQAQLKEKEVEANPGQQLITNYESMLQRDGVRLQTLERRIKQNQAISR